MNDILLISLAALAAGGWGLWWGERARNIDLRALLTYGSLPERTQPLSFLSKRVEQPSPDTMPEFDEAMIDGGAADLLALAKNAGVELSRDDARRQAIAMLQEAHGFGGQP